MSDVDTHICRPQNPKNHRIRLFYWTFAWAYIGVLTGLRENFHHRSLSKVPLVDIGPQGIKSPIGRIGPYKPIGLEIRLIDNQLTN